MAKKDTQIVYVLTNDAMPGIIKIGMTQRSIEQRMRDLYSSGVPVPFECYHASVVQNAQDVEKRLHNAFEKYRTNQNREFFEIKPESVVEILEMLEIENVTPTDDIIETPTDLIAMRRLEKRADRFSFKLVGIETQSTLTFAKDENVTCVVLDNNKVRFKDLEMSLSAAALEALKDEGHVWKSAQGAAYWQFDGKLLKDLREQLENE